MCSIAIADNKDLHKTFYRQRRTVNFRLPFDVYNVLIRLLGSSIVLLLLFHLELNAINVG
jgi:hypothetical protein